MLHAADSGERTWHHDHNGVPYAADWLHQIILDKCGTQVVYNGQRAARLDHLAFAIMLVRLTICNTLFSIFLLPHATLCLLVLAL